MFSLHFETKTDIIAIIGKFKTFITYLLFLNYEVFEKKRAFWIFAIVYVPTHITMRWRVSRPAENVETFVTTGDWNLIS